MSDGYRFTVTEDALGVVVELHGPGMPRHANTLHLLQLTNSWAQGIMQENRGLYPAREARRFQSLLDSAYEAGKRARSEEISELLGTGKR